MPPPPERSLRELQSAFAAGLRGTDDRACPPLDWAGNGGAAAIDAASRLGVYRNNTRYFFRTALERTYPVLRHRVGDEYFRQLAHEYRADHPSTHGDLQDVGRHFPTWLANRQHGTQYEWLAEIARLEWACESASTAADAAPVSLAVLTEIPSDRLDDIHFFLQPSVHFVASTYPVWSVWQANQGAQPGPAVDLAAGAEHCVVACGADRVAVYRLAADDYALVMQLAHDASLGEAIAALSYDVVALPPLLAWLFDERLVTGVHFAPER